jgi:hypothetical protein
MSDDKFGKTCTSAENDLADASSLTGIKKPVSDQSRRQLTLEDAITDRQSQKYHPSALRITTGGR